MPRITIEFPKDRARRGVLRFWSDDMQMRFGCPCLGTIAAGDYRVVCLLDPGNPEFGPNKTLLLAASAGDALTAKINGRPNPAIHGGELAADETLRPSQGARVANLDMLSILFAIAMHGEPRLVIVSEVGEEV